MPNRRGRVGLFTGLNRREHRRPSPGSEAGLAQCVENTECEGLRGVVVVVAMVDKSRQEKGKEKEDRENPQTNMMVISSTRVLSSGFHICHTSPELIIVPVFCREAIYLKLSYATCQITQVEWETLAGLPEATECSGRIQTDMGGDWSWQVDTQLSRVLSLN